MGAERDDLPPGAEAAEPEELGPASEPSPSDDGDADAPEGLVAHYDAAELEQLVAISFSAGELSDFAKGFGVFTSRDGSAREAARTLIRAVGRRDALHELADQLRERKPLVEWPDAEWRSAEKAATSSDAALPTAGGPPSSGPPSSGSPTGSSSPDRPAGAGAAPAEGAIRDPFAASAADDGDAKDRTSLRLVFAIGGGVLLAGVLGGLVVLFAIGRPSERGQTRDGAVSLAERASTHLRDAVGAVSRACDAEVSASSARDSLTTAFRRCASPDGPVPSGRAAGAALPPLLPSVTPRPPGAAPPPPRESPRPTGPQRCVERCETLHRQCIASKCGAEPTVGSKYDAYQRCLGGCLTRSSRCRLLCR